MLPIVFFIISLPDFIGRRDYLNCQRFERCLKIVRLVCHQANKSISEEEIRFFFRRRRTDSTERFPGFDIYQIN